MGDKGKLCDFDRWDGSPARRIEQQADLGRQVVRAVGLFEEDDGALVGERGRVLLLVVAGGVVGNLASGERSTEQLMEARVQATRLREVTAILRQDLTMAQELQSLAVEERLCHVEEAVVGPGNGKVRIAVGKEPLRRSQGPLRLREQLRTLAQATRTPSLRTWRRNGSSLLA